MVTEESTRASYNDWHQSRITDVGTDTPWHGLIRSYLTSADITDARVLEIGCGRGGFACWLATRNERPASIIAADFSPAAVNIGRELSEARSIQTVSWNVADIENLPFPNSSFGTVISAETIEHVPHPQRALDELARVLQPGGRLFLTTPNYMNLFGLYRIYLRLVGRPYTEMGQPRTHFVMLPRTTAWVRLAGLEIEHIDSTQLLIPIPGRHPKSVKAVREFHFVQKWFGLQSCVVARKPATKRSGGPSK